MEEVEEEVKKKKLCLQKKSVQANLATAAGMPVAMKLGPRLGARSSMSPRFFIHSSQLLTTIVPAWRKGKKMMLTKY